jgi:hypothetical protein
MPSKVYGCIESGGDILYVGSTYSDVHLLCTERLPPTAYYQVPTGRPKLVATALEALADRALGSVRESVEEIGQRTESVSELNRLKGSAEPVES